MILIYLGLEHELSGVGEEFPSPCGDYGSYHLQANCITIISLLDSFRPLTGIMVLIRYRQEDSQTVVNKCFRPLTGIMVLILKFLDTHIGNLKQFPSPYGDYGSYRIITYSYMSFPYIRFPSPYGDYGSYLRWEAGYEEFLDNFRPLTGIMVLILRRRI